MQEEDEFGRNGFKTSWERYEATGEDEMKMKLNLGRTVVIN